MQSALDEFQISIARVRDLISLHNSELLTPNSGDIDPTFAIGSRWPIDEVLVNDAVEFIEEVIESIHQIL
jgi:hypothetical protein